MEFDEVIRRRRMVRAFQDRPVEEEKIQTLLRHAHRAPSAGFTQPQEYVVVRDPEVRQALGRAALSQMFVAQAPVVIVVCADTRRSARRYGQRGESFYSVIDGAFAAMIILLAAVNEGLGCAFVGAFDDDEVSRVLGLPAHVRPIGILPVGYPDDRPRKFKRIPLESIVHRERWTGEV